MMFQNNIATPLEWRAICLQAERSGLCYCGTKVTRSTRPSLLTEGERAVMVCANGHELPYVEKPMPTFVKPSTAFKAAFIEELERLQKEGKTNAVAGDTALMNAVGKALDAMQERWDTELRRLRADIPNPLDPGFR